MFLKKNKEIHSDRIWLNIEAKFNGILKEVNDSLLNNKIVFVVSFFSDSYNKINEQLSIKSIPFRYYDSNEDKFVAVDYADGTTIKCYSFMCNNIQNINDVSSFQLLNKLFVSIIAVERHPLNSETEKLKLLSKNFSQFSLTYHYSIDEPVFKLFGGERINNLLLMLGLKEEEAIEHPMVARAIENAIEKLNSKIKSNLDANSLQEWFDKNL